LLFTGKHTIPSSAAALLATQRSLRKGGVSLDSAAVGKVLPQEIPVADETEETKTQTKTKTQTQNSQILALAKNVASSGEKNKEKTTALSLETILKERRSHLDKLEKKKFASPELNCLSDFRKEFHIYTENMTATTQLEKHCEACPKRLEKAMKSFMDHEIQKSYYW
jgi:hypothetical protein